MTGKRSDSTAPQSEPLSNAARKRLEAELAQLDEAAASIESRNGQRDTYYHTRAAEIRAQLETNEVTDGKLD